MNAEAAAKNDLHAEMLAIGRAARAAAAELALASAEAKSKALMAAAAAMRQARDAILAANARDMAAAEQKNLTGALLDRLKLDEKRVEATAKGLEEIAAFPDPDRRRAGGMDAAQRPHDPARARAARRHRHHLRVAGRT